MVDQTGAKWNQLVVWLRQLEGLCNHVREAYSTPARRTVINTDHSIRLQSA